MNLIFNDGYYKDMQATDADVSTGDVVVVKDETEPVSQANSDVFYEVSMEGLATEIEYPTFRDKKYAETILSGSLT